MKLPTALLFSKVTFEKFVRAELSDISIPPPFTRNTNINKLLFGRIYSFYDIINMSEKDFLSLNINKI